MEPEGGEERATARGEVAYHEAAHAVMAYLLDQEYIHVTIIPDEEVGNLGHIRQFEDGEESEPEADPDVARLEVSLLISLAGGIAGERISGVYNEAGCGSDFRNAVSAASFMSGNETDMNDRMERLNERAKQLVDWSWPAIEALAAGLLERDTLSAEEANRIIADALPHERKGAAFVLRGRVEELEYVVRELQSTVNTMRQVIQLPIRLVNRTGLIVGEINEETETIRLPAPGGGRR